MHWREFLASLQGRGLHGVTCFVSDAHGGVKAARAAVFPGVPWQRCQFHLQQNAQAYVPKHPMKAQVSADIRAIFNAPDDASARELLKRFVANYSKSAPKLAELAEANIAEGLAIMQLPPNHWRRLRTTNMLERQNKEIKRRTRVATLFPNAASCLRLVSAVLMEISEDWETDRDYLTM